MLNEQTQKNFKMIINQTLSVRLAPIVDEIENYVPTAGG
jgi:hypothetical protein